MCRARCGVKTNKNQQRSRANDPKKETHSEHLHGPPPPTSFAHPRTRAAQFCDMIRKNSKVKGKSGLQVREPSDLHRHLRARLRTRKKNQ